MKRAFVLSGLVALAAPAVACSTTTQDDATTSSDQLRTLDPSEIVGALTYGETSAPVAYSSNPTYRAFSFTAAPGDAVDVWVRSANGGDAHAWLLGSSYATLASNADGDSTTHDAHIAHTLKSGGTYYVAFRDEAHRSATFTVTLNKTNGPPAGGASDPFDPASCQGAPMTQAQAAALFAPGATTAPFGRFRIYRHYRTCTQATGCSSWSAGGPSGTWNDLEGKSELYVQGSSIGLRLLSDNVDQGCLAPKWGDRVYTTCGTVNGSSIACNSFISSSLWQSWQGQENCFTYNLDLEASSDVRFTGTLTSSCMRLSAKASSQPAANGQWTESEAVLMKSCATATTCREQNKNCGTIPDGCGGTLDCGGCSGGNTCGGGGTANVCGGAPPPCGGACTGGRVCCYDPLEGHDDCFDACN